MAAGRVFRTLGPVNELKKSLFGDSEGWHATPAEISLTYHAYPEHVKNITVTPDIAPLGLANDAFDFRERYPDGRVGANSNLASVEAGQLIFQTAREELIKDYKLFLEAM